MNIAMYIGRYVIPSFSKRLALHNTEAYFSRAVQIKKINNSTKGVSTFINEDDADTLEIFYGLKLVTTHNRDDTTYAYTQKDSHNLPGRHGNAIGDPTVADAILDRIVHTAH